MRSARLLHSLAWSRTAERRPGYLILPSEAAGKMSRHGLIDSGSRTSLPSIFFTAWNESDIKVLLGEDYFLGYAWRYKGTTNKGEGIAAVSLYFRFTALRLDPAFCHFVAEPALSCRHDQSRRYAVQQRPAAMQRRQRVRFGDRHRPAPPPAARPLRFLLRRQIRQAGHLRYEPPVVRPPACPAGPVPPGQDHRVRAQRGLGARQPGAALSRQSVLALV